MRILTAELLPMCAYCKGVRDDANGWHKAGDYITTHANVRFTHGICPECLPGARAATHELGE
jgi:hypothetical protein